MVATTAVLISYWFFFVTGLDVVGGSILFAWLMVALPAMLLTGAQFSSNSGVGAPAESGFLALIFWLGLVIITLFNIMLGAVQSEQLTGIQMSITDLVSMAVFFVTARVWSLGFVVQPKTAAAD